VGPADPAPRRLTEGWRQAGGREFLERSKPDGQSAHQTFDVQTVGNRRLLQGSASAADATPLVARPFTNRYNSLQTFTKRGSYKFLEVQKFSNVIKN
jgi:hypothetical protein